MGKFKIIPGMEKFSDRYEEVDRFLEQINIMSILKSTMAYMINGEQPELKLEVGGNSYVDNELIIIGLKDEYVLEDFHTIYTVLIGLLGRYTQHFQSSNYDEYNKYSSKMVDLLIDNNISEKMAVKTVDIIASSIERGRVDGIVCRKLPGIKTNIKMLNIHKWEWSIPLGANKYKDILETISFLSEIGVYPKGFEKNYKDTIIERLIIDIKPYINKAINGNNSKETMKYIENIINIIVDFLNDNEEYMREDLKKAEEIEEFLRNIKEDADFKSNKEIEFNHKDGPSDNTNPSHLEDDFNRKESNNIELDKEREITAEDIDDTTIEIDLKGEEDSLADMEELKKEYLEHNREEFVELEKMDSIDDKEYDQQRGQITDDEVKGLLQGYGSLYDYEYEDNDFPLIQISKDLKIKGKRFRKDIEDIFKNRNTMDLMEQDQGILNQDDIYKIMMNNYDIFIEEGIDKESEYVAYILHDGSYSMHKNDKYELSLKALAILEEGLKGIIPFKIVSFRASNIAIHRLIKDFDDESNKNYSYSFYKSSKPENANEDGFSVEIATNELLDRPETDKILVILSDGMPMNKEKLVEAVKDARRKGIYIISIFFGTEEFRKDHIEDYKYMYQDNIISASPELIPKRLTNLFKRILIR